jgi:hypothetical protein
MSKYGAGTVESPEGRSWLPMAGHKVVLRSMSGRRSKNHNWYCSSVPPG